MKLFNRNKYDRIIFPKEQLKFLNEFQAMIFKEDLSILNENLEIDIYDSKTFDLSEIENQDFFLLQQNNNLVYLHLPVSDLRSIPKSIKKIHSIIEIVISPLWMNSDKIFRYFPPNLKKLTIHFCNLPFIPESIYKLTNLEELTLDDTGIEVIPDSIIELKNLKELSILDNPIQNLPESVFSHPTLEEITIGYESTEDFLDVIQDKLHTNHCLIISEEFITIKNTSLVPNTQQPNAIII